MPLIVFEGIDGSGKSTQVELLAHRLARESIGFRRLREPGGTVLGEKMRAILLDPATHACPTAELFGYLQARAQLCHEILQPALAARDVVLLDRFYHSTIAYQAYGLGLDITAVRAAISLAVGSIKPDLVFWLDCDPAEAIRRRSAARGSNDRIEGRGIDYMRRVHDGFAALARAGEMVRLDARLPSEQLADEVWSQVTAIVGSR
jgi:dTMP kinase